MARVVWQRKLGQLWRTKGSSSLDAAESWSRAWEVYL